MKHAIDTRRLRIFRDALEPADHYIERELFVAFRTDEDRPMVCATALLIFDPVLFGGWWVDWLEVTSEYRRMGFGREFLQGITAVIGEEAQISGGSVVGGKFCRAIERERRRRAAAQEKHT